MFKRAYQNLQKNIKTMAPFNNSMNFRNESDYLIRRSIHVMQKPNKTLGSYSYMSNHF